MSTVSSFVLDHPKSITFLFLIIIVLEIIQMFPSDHPSAYSDYYIYIAFFMVIVMSVLFSILLPQNIESVLIILIPCICMFIPIFMFLFAKSKVIKVFNSIDAYSFEEQNNLKEMNTSDPNILIFNIIYLAMTVVFGIFIGLIIKNMKNDNYVIKNNYIKIIFVSSVLFVGIEISNYFIFKWYKKSVIKQTDDNIFKEDNEICKKQLYSTN